MAISQIVQNSLADTISLGVKVATINIANSGYSILDDTAVNVGGGFIVITGDGFKSGAQVLVDNVTACSVSVVSGTQIRAEVPSRAAGTYNVYVANSDGATGLKVNGLTYSGTPTWVTASALANQVSNVAFTGNFNATGATLYQLQTGSSFPTGLSIANTANGFFVGNVNTSGSDTTYNFTVEAIDTENQESPRAFSLSVNSQPLIPVTTGLYAQFDAAWDPAYTMSGSNVTEFKSRNNPSNIQMRPHDASRYGVKGTAGSLGKQVMNFNTYQYWIYDAVQTTMDDFSIFMLMSVPAASIGDLYNYFGTNNNTTGEYMGLGEANQGNGSEMDWIYGFANDARFSLSGNSPVNVNSTTSGLRLYVIESTGFRDTTTVRVNKTNASMSYTGNNISLSWKLSQRTTTPGTYPYAANLIPYFGHNGSADHKLAELIIYDGKLSSGDRTSVEDYLTSKWGTLS